MALEVNCPGSKWVGNATRLWLCCAVKDARSCWLKRIVYKCIRRELEQKGFFLMIFFPIIFKLDHVTFVPIFAYPDIDECESAPCVRGTCTDQENGYECTCEDGFTGMDCDTGMYFIYFILQNNFTIRLAVPTQLRVAECKSFMI